MTPRAGGASGVADHDAELRLLVADDHPQYRRGLARVCRLIGGFGVVAEVSDVAEALAAVLVKLLADRQLTAPAGLIEWLVPRMDRDLGLARRLVAALDTETMAERRGLTRQLAGDLLAKLAEDEAAPR